MAMKGEDEIITIKPTSINFISNRRNVEHILVTNVSRNMKTITFYPPKSQEFDMEFKTLEKSLATGLTVTIPVRYKGEYQGKQLVDKLTISIGDRKFEVSLIVTSPCCILSLTGEVDFGCMVANNVVNTRSFEIKNKGLIPGEFKVKYLGSTSLILNPKEGFVPPLSSQSVTLYFCATEPEKFEEVVTVHLENTESHDVIVSGQVIYQELKLLDPETEKVIDKIQFGYCYYGCDLIQFATLYNNSPIPANFVAVLDKNAAGEEIDSNVTEPASVVLMKKVGMAGGRSNVYSGLLDLVPSEGRLKPYEKLLIAFLFKPRWHLSQFTWKSLQEPPPRRDFVLFINFNIVGIPFPPENQAKHNLEVPVIGTALPVLISLEPEKYHFGSCAVGKKCETESILLNYSPVLPVKYQFKNGAHFRTKPSKGVLQPGQQERIKLSFIPKQIGNLQTKNVLQVQENIYSLQSHDDNYIAQKSTGDISYYVSSKIIYSSDLHMQGMGVMKPVERIPKFNIGTIPYITNEVGINGDILFENVDQVPRNAMAAARPNKIKNMYTKGKNNILKCLIALPNDMAQSIKPSQNDKIFRTLFTKKERYTYLDDDYTYTEKELEKIMINKNKYKDLISKVTKQKLQQKLALDYMQSNNNVDIGLSRDNGIRPKKLSISDIPAMEADSRKQKSSIDPLISNEFIEEKGDEDEYKVIPITAEEKLHCSTLLSPGQLYKLMIGPSKINFGKVCQKSLNRQYLEIINTLDIHVFVQLKLDCPELRQTCPLSKVVSPLSKTGIPIVFESSNEGKFSTSIHYTINNSYTNCICVQAEVVNVKLEIMSGSFIVLNPIQSMPSESAFSEFITLSNKLNYPAEFSWVKTSNDTSNSFNIYPSQGIVEEFQDLDCEVTWLPSYTAPDLSTFRLDVKSGEPCMIDCKAQIGTATVQFFDRRITFVNSPVNLTSRQNATIVNTSMNHAYFKVLETNPVPGMVITPVTGIVPAGGETDLKLSFTPRNLVKFDFNLEVDIRGGKLISVRVGGFVSMPCVEIDVSDFVFGGVYCGSMAVIPFNIINKNNNFTQIDFDLSIYPDFHLIFNIGNTQEAVHLKENTESKVYSISIDGMVKIEGKMVFEPTEVAAYNFMLPVYVNYGSLQISSISQLDNSDSSDKKSPQPRPYASQHFIPKQKVIASGLRPIFELSSYKINFNFVFTQHKSLSKDHIQSQDILMENKTSGFLHWDFDLSEFDMNGEHHIFSLTSKSGEKLPVSKEGYTGRILGAFQSEKICITCAPKTHTNYNYQIPIYINENYKTIHKYLQVSVNMKYSNILFKPAAIYFRVPLRIEDTIDIRMEPVNYPEFPTLKIEYPSISVPDGKRFKAFEATILENNALDNSEIITCHLKFKSDLPVSFRGSIKFIDQFDNCFELTTVAIADNSVLTCYPFLVDNPNSHKIICQPCTRATAQTCYSVESSDAGEPICVRCEPSRNSISYFSSSYISEEEEEEESLTDFNSSSQNIFTMRHSYRADSADFSRETPEHFMHKGYDLRIIGKKIFPENDKPNGTFHIAVLHAIQKWISTNGWAGGSVATSIPHTFRNAVGTVEERKSTKAHSVKKESKTIYHMLKYLTGKVMPGVLLNPTLPSNPVDRVKQIHHQHKLLLILLRCQGGYIDSIKPEYLMTYQDFILWKEISRVYPISPGFIDEDEGLKDREIFEMVAKKAWLDVLLQIIKCFVIAKISTKSFKTIFIGDKELKMPTISKDSLVSNIYSEGERILLAWMNRCYEQNRHLLWRENSKKPKPVARWILNFDVDLKDGLVLACLFGTYLPFMVSSHISRVYTNPVYKEQYFHNAVKIVSVMRCLGIEYNIQAIDIANPNPINMILFCSFLFHCLPQYCPRCTLEFRGKLHESITKVIKLSNPSVKQLNYSVTIFGEGASKISISKGKTISIPAKQTIHLPINYNNTYVASRTATIVLTGRRLGSELGTHLVFSVVTYTTQEIPQNIISIDSHCYEYQSINIEVVNPFNVGGEFCISVVEENFESTSIIKSIGLLKTVCGLRDSQEYIPADKTSVKSLKSFHCQTPSVYLEESGKKIITIIFLPFFMGTSRCYITLSNYNIGDFIYEIKALAKTPLPSSLDNFDPYREESKPYFGRKKKQMKGDENKTQLYWKCEMEELLERSIWIPLVNLAKEKALIKLARMKMSQLEFQRRKLTNTLECSSRAAKAYAEMTHLTENVLRNWQKEMNTLAFTIEYNNRNFSFPNKVLFEIKESRKENILGLQNEYFEVPVKFSAESAGHFECQILMTAKDDIRLYKLECTTYPKGSNIEIEFQTPVLHKIIQDIPITNPTSNPWSLKAIVEGEPFSGPDTFLVAPNTTALYPIYYRPSLEEAYKGSLKLLNGNDVIEDIKLVGNASSPLAMGEIVITSEVKAKAVHVLNVPNRTKKRLTYEVQSSVPFTSGNKLVTVSSAQVAMYNLHIQPTMGGDFEGIINFVVNKRMNRDVDSDGDEAYSSGDEDEYIGHRLWYIIKLHVRQGPPESVLRITCPCQDSQVINVPVTNPLDEELSLKTIIEGHHVTGPSSITLSAGEKILYPLTYSPQNIMKQKGVLKFFNPNFGEFWYELILESKPPIPINLYPMQCQLGMSISQTVVIKNNSNLSSDLTPEITDSNFLLYENGFEVKSLHLEPNCSKTITLTFKPSALNNKRLPCNVIFHSKRFDQIKYSVVGYTLIPTEMSPLTVSAVSGFSSEFILNFHNPLNELVYVSIKLTDFQDGSHIPASVFSIDLLKKNSILLGPFQILGIPITFCPVTRTTYRTTCTVSICRAKEELWHFKDQSLDTIVWTFPLIGIPEFQDIDQMPMSIFNCDVRKSANFQLVIKLTTNMDDIDDAILSANVYSRDVVTSSEFEDDYRGPLPDISFHLEFSDNLARYTLSSIVTIELLQTFTKHDNSDHVVLIFGLKFSPMKNTKSLAHLAITKKNGCVWRFPLTFIAENPVIDDTIVIKALKLKEKYVTRFYLHSNEDYPQDFQVLMTPESDAEIIVTPKSGVLPVESDQGIEMNVSFTPIAYGQENFATLLIQTSSMQWTYNIWAYLAKYEPPKGRSMPPIAGPHPIPKIRGPCRDFIQENCQLTKTAASSPIQGGPLVYRDKKKYKAPH